MEWAGARMLMIYFAVLLALLAGFAWLRRRVGARVETGDQAEFVLMARASPAVLELDPRVGTGERGTP